MSDIPYHIYAEAMQAIADVASNLKLGPGPHTLADVVAGVEALRRERDLFCDDAIPKAAEKLNEMSAERDQLRQLVHDLWAAWNDDTITLLATYAVVGETPSLDLSPGQQKLLDDTIRWVHNWTAEQLETAPQPEQQEDPDGD